MRTLTRNIVIHVGPHKTGTTSIQHALYKARETLLHHGVYYPPSLPDAQFREQHADVAFLIRDNLTNEIDAYLTRLEKDAQSNGADTIILSSEAFSALFGRPEFLSFISKAREHWNVDIVYMMRKTEDLVYSNIMQHLSGDIGQFSKYDNDIDRMIITIAEWNKQRETFFKDIGARFIDFEGLDKTKFNTGFVASTIRKDFGFLENRKLHTTADKRKHARLLMLSYPIRLLLSMKEDISIVSPRCFAASEVILKHCKIDEELMEGLLQDFDAFLRSRIRAVLSSRNELS
jgi:hypothetical protein